VQTTIFSRLLAFIVVAGAARRCAEAHAEEPRSASGAAGAKPSAPAHSTAAHTATRTIATIFVVLDCDAGDTGHRDTNSTHERGPSNPLLWLDVGGLLISQFQGSAGARSGGVPRAAADTGGV